MKIAIPADGVLLESQMCSSFGRTEQFILVDTDTMRFDVLTNEAAHSQGGAGIVAAQALVDSGISAVVAMHCGKNAADVLQGAGIPIYRGMPGTIDEIVKRYQDGTLAILEEIHPGHHLGR
jgi:predicted Fe-Mo cluster-binding NifX family protein